MSNVVASDVIKQLFGEDEQIPASLKQEMFRVRTEELLRASGFVKTTSKTHGFGFILVECATGTRLLQETLFDHTSDWTIAETKEKVRFIDRYVTVQYVDPAFFGSVLAKRCLKRRLKVIKD